jgi:hypothetical protein
MNAIHARSQLRYWPTREEINGNPPGPTQSTRTRSPTSPEPRAAPHLNKNDVTVTNSHRSGSGIPGYLGYLLMALGIAALVQVAIVNGRIALLGQTAEGLVIDVERSERARGATTPVVRFSTPNGESVVFRGFAQFRSPYAVGDRVRVRYVAAAPSRAEIDAWATLWRALVVALSIATALIGGGIAIVRKSRSRR